MAIIKKRNTLSNSTNGKSSMMKKTSVPRSSTADTSAYRAALKDKRAMASRGVTAGATTGGAMMKKSTPRTTSSGGSMMMKKTRKKIGY